MHEVMRRLNTLENAQRKTVESVLEQIRDYIRNPSFTKERALDMLISLRILAKESSHPKSSFYDAVLRAMQDKSRASDYQYKMYLRSLLGDKEDEKVLEAMAKVEKAMRVAEPGPSRSRSRGWDRGSGVVCYSCNRRGHYQRFCPYRREHEKRQSRGQTSQDRPKN